MFEIINIGQEPATIYDTSKLCRCAIVIQPGEAYEAPRFVLPSETLLVRREGSRLEIAPT